MCLTTPRPLELLNHMVNLVEEQLSRTFQALADPTRRDILRRIATEDVTVAEIGEPYPISAPAVSKHLKSLENARLIRRIKDGKKRRFILDPAPLAQAQETMSCIAAFWLQRLGNLEEFLTNTNPK